MDDIVEIDGKTYSVKLGKSKTFDISPFVKTEVNALLSENEEKFQAALKPTLDNPALIAGASVELNIVTKITEKEGGVEVAEYSESVDEKELFKQTDKLMGELRKEILVLKKNLEKDRETRKEMDEVYSSDYENYRERRAKLIEERKQLKDGEEDKEEDLTERIEFLTKELKQMLGERKILDSRIKGNQKSLSIRESLLDKIKIAMKEDDLAELEELVLEELEGPRVEISTSKERLEASSTAKIITSFAKDWEEGFPVLYQIKINKMGEFDLNPYARQKGSPKSFDKDIFDGLKAILNRIYRVQKVIA
jgi:pyruvate-formate lyase